MVVLGRRINPKPISLAEHAQAIVIQCRGPDVSGCYDEEIPKLMDQLTMEDVFAVTKLIQDRDPSYTYCHVLGHELSSRETKKDPSRWQDVVTRCPSGICSNGCIHGAFQERYRTEVLSDSEIEGLFDDFRRVCTPRGNWHPTEVERASCYHSLGHLLMYVTGGKVEKATAICERLNIAIDGSDYTQVCYDGAFMQIFQPLEPEDFALVSDIQKDISSVEAFCFANDGKKRSSCWSESWPIFRAQFMDDGALLEAHCAKLPGEERDRCLQAILYALVVQFRFDRTELLQFCLSLSPGGRVQCFSSVATRLIETDYRNAEAAVSWCGQATPESVRRLCFDELATYATFYFHKDSESHNRLCQALPRDWQIRCFEGIIRGKDPS